VREKRKRDHEVGWSLQGGVFIAGLFIKKIYTLKKNLFCFGESIKQ
jgi:hypothetical protein